MREMKRRELEDVNSELASHGLLKPRKMDDPFAVKYCKVCICVHAKQQSVEVLRARSGIFTWGRSTQAGHGERRLAGVGRTQVITGGREFEGLQHGAAA